MRDGADRRQVLRGLGGLGGAALVTGGLGGSLGLLGGCNGEALITGSNLAGGGAFKNPPILTPVVDATGRAVYNLTMQLCEVTLGEPAQQQKLSLICYTDGTAGGNAEDPATPEADTPDTPEVIQTLPKLNRPAVGPTWVVMQDAPLEAKVEPVLVNLHNRIKILPNGLPDSADTGTMDDPPEGSRITNLHTHGLHVWPQQDNVFVELAPNERAAAKIPKMVCHDPSTLLPDTEGLRAPTAIGSYPYYYNFGSTAPLPPSPPAGADGASAAPSATASAPVPAGAAPVSVDQADAALAGAVPGQAVRLPAGTYWYHPHKHGSVAYQVGNGLTGMMIVRGDVDRIPEIKDLTEQVIVIQAIAYSLDTNGQACTVSGSGVPQTGYVDPRSQVGSAPNDCPQFSKLLTVNGQVAPVITMQAGEIQRWRVLNSTYDSFVYLTVETAEDDTGEVVQVLNLIGVDGVPLTHVPGTIQVPFPTGASKTLPLPYNLASSSGPAVTSLSLQQVLTDELSVLAPGQRYTALAAIPAGQSQSMLYVKARFYPYVRTCAPYSCQTVPPPQVLMMVNVTGTKATPDPMPSGDRFAGPVLFRPPLDRAKTPRPVNIAFDFCAPTQGGGSVTIGDAVTWFNGCGPQLVLKLGERTAWKVVGRGGAHAFHIHINSFMMTKRFGLDISAAAIWRDTVRLDQQLFNPTPGDTIVQPTASPVPVAGSPPPPAPPPPPACYVPTESDRQALLYEVEFESQQEDFTGDFVLHCHALHHEDMGMMVWVRIVDGDLPPPDNAGKEPDAAPSAAPLN